MTSSSDPQQWNPDLSWDIDSVPDIFTALSADRRVRASVGRDLQVRRVEILDASEPETLAEAIMEAVNEATERAEGLETSAYEHKTSKRVDEFNALLDGLESGLDDVDQRLRSRRR